MKKSAVFTILIPAIVGFAVMAGIFMGRITSGDRIQVEKHEIPTESTDEVETTGLPIDINIADASELSQLPGIGEVLAKRIVDYREKNGPFKNVQELLNVSGIGESKLNDMIDYIRIGEQK